MKLTNGVPFGFGPDEDNGGTMAQINQISGKKAATYVPLRSIFSSTIHL